jgi:hypothetical protein
MDKDNIITAYKNCVMGQKCEQCQWHPCEVFENMPRVSVPIDLALAVHTLLDKEKAVKPDRRLSKNKFKYNFCGKCAALLVGGEPNYCQMCGTPIDWSE